jgi:glutamate--cysteine ligase
MLTAAGVLTQASHEARLRQLFMPPVSPAGPRIGAEVEFLVLNARTQRPASTRESLLPLLHAHGAARGWRFVESGKGGPRYTLPSGGVIAIEPGGQLEYASPPFPSPAALLADLHAVLVPLSDDAGSRGIRFLGAGIDPHNAFDAAPLQIEAERYRRMDAYFAAIGPAGQRMMRQTAAVQLNVDPVDAHGTWRMLNAAAPVLVAAFANSRLYAGTDSGHASCRAETWRHADASRTGLFPCEREPAEEYAAFVLCARTMLVPGTNGAYPPFRELGALADEATLANHLTTLFPEIRPKGYLEIRSIDAQAIEWLAAPVLVAGALALDARAMQEAAERLGAPDALRLETAGRRGLRDAWLHDAALDVFDIAIRACVRRGQPWYGGRNLETAIAFRDRFTRRGRAPGDEAALPSTDVR